MALADVVGHVFMLHTSILHQVCHQIQYTYSDIFGNLIIVWDLWTQILHIS